MSAMISQSAVRRNEQRDLRLARSRSCLYLRSPCTSSSGVTIPNPLRGRTHPTHFGMMSGENFLFDNSVVPRYPFLRRRPFILHAQSLRSRRRV